MIVLFTTGKELSLIEKHVGKNKHSIVLHHYFIDHKMDCSYCKDGSEIVPMAEIIGDLENWEGVEL